MTELALAPNAVERHAWMLLNLLVDCGPMTSAEIAIALDWPRGRVGRALHHARELVCPQLGVSIPSPTPFTGWRYEVTTNWEPVEAGASFTLGQVESRLKAILRDVIAVKPHIERGTIEWRRANFLSKHLSHILGTLEEINNG